jgi:hypothetical protein
MKRFLKCEKYMQNNRNKNFRSEYDNWNERIIFLKVIPFIVFGVLCIYNLFSIEHIFVFDPNKSEVYYVSLLFLPFMVSFQIISIILVLFSFFLPKQNTDIGQDKDTDIGQDKGYLSCKNIRQDGIKYFIVSTLYVVYFLCCR